ncbi:hypothetical protein C5S53_17690 [Methanophagales archaeon]|nr:hypothetical protein C5S53_17690 [Methanophagales archaeon]
MVKMRKILKYGLLFLAISLVGIWIFVYFRHFLVQLPRISIILNEIAERPSLLAAIAILGVLLAIIKIIIPIIKWIYSHIKREKINLPTIDWVLKRDEIKDTPFDKFLKERKDPYWIDFEKGYITKRREVDEVVAKLEKNRVHLIIGSPSSGKSLIIKNIGYELRKKKYEVFVKELKTEELDINDIIEKISKMKKKKTLLIIDDIHLGLTEYNKLKCNELLGGIGKPKIKILLSGRDIIEEKIEPLTTTPLAFLMQDKKTCTKINAIDAVEDILINFENKSNIKIEEENRRELREQYGHDLWVLSLALSLYDPECSIPTEKELIKKIKELLTVDDYKWIHADDIILPISAFYCYEAPVAMRTLTKTLGLKEENIRELIHFGEIREKNWKLSLHHSSRAKLYLETFKEYKELGENVKETIQKKFGDWYIGLFHLYFRSKPKVCVGLLSRLANEYKESITKEDIVSELLKDDDTKKAIFENIVESMEVKNVKRLKDTRSYVSNRTFSKEFLEYFSEEDLLEFLNNSKINQLGSFLSKGYYSINVQNVYQRFSRESFLLRKMNDATLGEIGVFIYGIRQVKFKKNVLKGAELALDAIEKLKEVDNLPQKLGEATLKNISLLIQNINEVGGDPKFIIDKLSPPFDLIKKMEESTLDYIGLLIVGLKRNDAEHLIEGFDLAGKVEESPLIKLNYFVWNISADQSLSVKYNKIIEDHDLVEKIEMSDLNTINRFLWNLFQTSSSVPKTFTDTKVRNVIVNCLNDKRLFSVDTTSGWFNLFKLKKKFKSEGIKKKKSTYLVRKEDGKLNIYIEENIGEKLCLIGIYEYANCSLLDANGEKISGIKISIPEIEEWFKKNINPHKPEPFKVALALKGFKAIDEENTISFINSHLNFKEVIDCLKKSEIKNSKSKQLIENMLSWLNGLEMEK